MNRRRALAWIAACSALSGVRARAQQQSAPRRIGYFSAASAAANAPRLAAFRQGMSELGWVDGKDYMVDARYGDARGGNISQLAADVVASRPDVILTPSDEGMRAFGKATKTIPIVFATGDDPVGLGVVKSMQRPGGNMTGLVTLRNELGAKRFQLLKESFPRILHVAVLFASGDAASVPQVKVIEVAAARLNVRVSPIEIKQPGDIEAAVKRGVALGCDAYVVADGFLLNTERRKVAEAVMASKRPAIFGRPEHVEAGGLMSYGAPPLENFRRSAAYVDKILKGANPGELPIEQPRKFELTINLKTAKAIGIDVPTSVLVRADKVIQ